ncbi:hypothetical protein U472_00450 [Orenia metallireducens]|jgi:hypothetical protein|uniref:Uncharacterized protein n=1 Tax=Orenia metallireducens TaxID=1413210 RepID=A0A1C0ADF0_9FIRM|nr:hypothetical protein [Orenia metallireducens]OCL28659.1 hypothetical protein U472_00450 [Orenia metallireducens]
MEVTDKVRKKLRQLLDEKITGDSASDTRFEEEEIDDLIIESSNIYQAAYKGWILKAGMLQREIGYYQSIDTGQESYTLLNLKTALNSAKDMVDMYKKLSNDYKKENESNQLGSFVLKVKSPEVL